MDYSKEAKEKWGVTKAYQEAKGKLSGKSESDKKELANGLLLKFSEFGKIKNLAPNSEIALQKVKELQEYITLHFYNCTKEILLGLGEMYVADDRFRKTIDTAGGEGTAEFVSKAIKEYCR